jgi:hypothetical protein
MNMNSNGSRIANGIEHVLTLLTTLVIAATPVCAIWALNSSSVVPLFS